MDFIKRALLSMKAKKGRTILLCAVFSAILIFVLAGLTIQRASVTATENAKKSIGAQVTLSANREAGMKKQQNSESGERPDPGSFSLTPVSLEDAEKIAKLDNVKSYSFVSSTSATAGDNITSISSSETESSTENSSNENQNAPDGGKQGGPMAGMSQGDFQISGVVDQSMASAFEEGTAKITSGEAITSDDIDTDNVVIEKTLAEANDLKVGDTFTLKNSDDETKTYKMTVKGIYTTSESGDSMGMRFNFLNPANTIYSSYTFANTLKGDDAKGTIDSATYTLSDPKEMDTFVKEAEKLIDTDSFSLQTNDQAYQQMLSPLNNVASFAKNIVILVAIAGIIILTLIVMMTIRERRYEIGVLLSLGESRFKVILQFFSEIVVCMIVALIIATFSGNIVGNVVGEQLINQQSQSSQTQTNQGGPGGGQPGGEDNQMPNKPSGGGMRGGLGTMGASSQEIATEIDNLNISVSGSDILKLTGLGLLISFLSILLSSLGILRLQPKKILTT
ncbi:ABC transporter permease [Vagococcus sp. JNUCC 83]